VSQLCKTDANYMPSAMATSSCFQIFATTDEFDAETCDGGYKYDLSWELDFDQDGQFDLACFFFDSTTSAEDCKLKFPNGSPMFYSSTCTDKGVDGEWSYTDSSDLEAKCLDSDIGGYFEMYASACCSDGVSVCGGGACFRGDNTVQVKTAAARSTLRHAGVTTTKKLTELKVGDYVATTEHHQMKWTKVVGLPHSKSTSDFVEVTMDESSSGSSPQVVAVTEHHTFQSCNDIPNRKKKMVAARRLRAGDCLRTSTGNGTVSKVQRIPAGPEDQTYTVVLEGGRDLIMLNGVVTHAKPQHAALTPSATKGMEKPEKHASLTPSATKGRKMPMVASKMIASKELAAKNMGGRFHKKG